MKHVLGVLGVLAAAVLLAVSAAINWRFGYSLGTTEFDGQIYGAASAAADCLKALVPFFFFAAIRNRMWSQAAASAVVWVVVTSYSMTSALGHAAHNRFDGASQRSADAQAYGDLRAQVKRAQDELSWIPRHRPAAAIESAIDSAKSERAWAFTSGCTEMTGRQGRDFCQRYHGLQAELASAKQAVVMKQRITELQAKLGQASGADAVADPQAEVLSQLTGIAPDKIQTAMTIFVALLLEIGSGFGMYIAFSQWRLYDSYAPRPSRAAARASRPLAGEAELAGETAGAVTSGADALAARSGDPLLLSPPSKAEHTAPPADPEPRSGSNDKVVPMKRPLPANNGERYYKERTEPKFGNKVPATRVYEDYKSWCVQNGKSAASKSRFTDELLSCGIHKNQSGQYVGIALKSDIERAEASKPAGTKTEAA